MTVLPTFVGVDSWRFTHCGRSVWQSIAGKPRPACISAHLALAAWACMTADGPFRSRSRPSGPPRKSDEPTFVRTSHSESYQDAVRDVLDDLPDPEQTKEV